ncbi:MAG: redox-regulated ATPase YchF [bacterium]
MGLSVGIVGLPNVGKSTLFNALLSKQQAYVANYPFATIEPNVGIVPVPDERLAKLAPIVNTTKLVPATVTFLDIAGLVKGASQGEGLGNKFLSHIRETDAIVHVIRAFTDPDIIKQGVTDPKSDFETIQTELGLADLEMQEKREKNPPSHKASEGQVKLALFADKPYLVAVNVDEGELIRARELEIMYAEMLGVGVEQIVIVCAKTEAELCDLTESEQSEYLRDLGVEESGLARLIKKAYAKLGLMSFLTAGELEVRAWTVPVGTMAPDAAGVIHTDFVKHFISAKVCSYIDFIEYQGWKGAAEKGKVRTEGKNYVMKEGDVVEFMIGT